MKPIFILLALSIGLFVACDKTEEPEEEPIEKEEEKNVGDPELRAAALKDYQENYLNNQTSNGWRTGSLEKCRSGIVSQEAFDLSLQRVNYFRRQAGLNDNITWVEDYNWESQEAALMIHANGNVLNHHPPKTWKCYTKLGDDGCAKSNLAYGSKLTTSQAVTNLMRDQNTPSVGHRRWFLYSRQSAMGVGATEQTAAFHVINDSRSNTEYPEMILWPPKGYVMQELVFDFWSFGLSIGGAIDFSEASINMTGPEGEITSKIYAYGPGPGDPSIVWIPEINLSGMTSGDERFYDVTIANVKVNGVAKDYSYQTIVLAP